MDIALYTVKSIAFIITQPFTLFGIAVFGFMFYRQNKKTAVMQKMIIGESLNSPIELTLSQIVIGIFAGIIGSVILSLLGVMFDENSAIILVFMVSLLFLVINPRYICFSYSGAVVGVLSVVLSEIAKANQGVIVMLYGQSFNLGNLDFLKIDITALMTLVGVMHVIEGLLVIIDGKAGAIPVFTNKEGRIIGGFALKRYWLLPITLMAISHMTVSGVDTVQMSTPDWWPILKPIIPMDQFKNAVITMIPLFAGVGYSSITFTRNKTEKSAVSGVMILLFGAVLALVAQVADINFITKISVCIFAPLAHEAMLRYGKYLENKGEPKYVSEKGSIMVLDVAPNTPAHEMGIKSGDKIIEINNNQIESEEQLLNIMNGSKSFFWFKLQRSSGKIEEVTYNKMNESKRLGIVFVPMSVPKDSLVVKFDEDKFSEILNRIKNRKD